MSVSDLGTEERNCGDVELEDKLAAAAAAAALMDVSCGLNCLLAASCLSSELTTDATTTTAPANNTGDHLGLQSEQKTC